MDIGKLENKIEICKWKFAASINDCEQLSRRVTDNKDHYEALAKGVVMGRDIFLRQFGSISKPPVDDHQARKNVLKTLKRIRGKASE